MKKKLDKELIVSLAAISFIVAVGIIFFLLFIFDIHISSNNAGGVIGSFSGLSSSIWLYLLCRNCWLSIGGYL